jgi:type I restriction enzyme, S subunit
MQDATGELRQQFTGTGIQHFTGETLDRLPIPVPPLSEVRRLVSQFEAVSSETDRLATIYRRKIAALDELKKSLLHQAFSGEL